MQCSNVVSSLPVVQANCCLFQFCKCINFAVLKSTEGILKLIQIILGTICQKLLISNHLTYSLSLGSSYYGFLTTVSASVITSMVLLICYILSNRTLQLLRQSLFEILFNGISSFLYLSSSCYLAFAVYTFLYPIYKFASIFTEFPAMSVTYVSTNLISAFLILGFIIGGVHGYDSWLAYKKYH